MASHLLPHEPPGPLATFQHILQEVEVAGKLSIGEARQGAKGRPIALAIAPGARFVLEAALEGARPHGASGTAVRRLGGPADGTGGQRRCCRLGIIHGVRNND